MLLAYSWLIRWKFRSAPERSAVALIPGYLASNALATAVTNCRSSEPYQTTEPSFFAAAIKSGVTGVGSGPAARASLAPYARRTIVRPMILAVDASLAINGIPE